MLRNTATPNAPWHVEPADNKWFTRVVVAAAIIDALASLKLHHSKVSAEKLKELAAAKRTRWGKEQHFRGGSSGARKVAVAKPLTAASLASISAAALPGGGDIV